MSQKSTYQPPYTITPEILNKVAAISEAVGRLTVLTDEARALRLRRINRIRTIHGSLAIEGNSLSEAQITAILVGKHVIAPPREVQEVKNALAAYDRFETWKPETEKDLLEAHRILMSGLIDRRCQTADDVAAWVVEVAKKNGLYGQIGQCGQNPAIQPLSTESTPSTLSTKTYPELSANTALTLLAVACALLDRQVERLAKDFENEGGFTERLYKVRTAKRRSTP